MKRNVSILFLICFILSSCSNKNDINTSNGTEIETTLVMETVINKSQIDTSQSSSENNEPILDQAFDVDEIFNGLAYKLGEENSTSEQTILKLKGSGRKNSFGDYWFQGILEIDGKEYHLIYENEEINILSYASSAGYTRTFGQVFINNDFSNVSISITEDGWSNEDGNMLTYPCETKDEGLDIANKLMEEYLLHMGTPKLK